MRLGIAVIVIACLLIAGCGGGNKLVGKWQSTKYSVVTFEFAADGKMTDGAGHSGAYKVEGNKVILTGGPLGSTSVSKTFSVSGDTLMFGRQEYKRIK